MTPEMTWLLGGAVVTGVLSLLAAIVWTIIGRNKE